MKKKIPTVKHRKLNDGFIELHYKDKVFLEKYIYTDEWWYEDWLPAEHSDKCLDMDIFTNQLHAHSIKYNNPVVISWDIGIYSRKLKAGRLSWTNEDDYHKSYTLNEFVETLKEINEGQWERYTTASFIGDAEIIILPIDKIKPKTKRQRTRIPRGLRHEVFKRDNYTCVECGARKEDGATLHVDHKIPVSKGGTDELDNLQTLCSKCNLNKSDVIQ